MSGNALPEPRASRGRGWRRSLFRSARWSFVLLTFASLAAGCTAPAHVTTAQPAPELVQHPALIQATVSAPPPPPLNVTNFTANATSTDVAVPVNFTVTPTGGSGNASNWNYTWTLPPGCVSSWAATDICSPSSKGTFAVHVLVTDTNTSQTGTTPTINLAVFSLPSVTVVVSGQNITLGKTIWLNATPSGGIAPYTYHYAQLPIGCKGNVSAVSLLCKPNATGVYSPYVTVTDSVGGTSSRATASVNVSAPAAAASQSGPGTTGWAVIAAIVIVGAIIVVALLVSARREERVSFMATPAQPPPGAAPPGPGGPPPSDPGSPPNPPMSGPPT